MTHESHAIVLTGPPGSGKSTMIDRIQSARQAVTIETGELLRRHVQGKTDIGTQVKPYVERGTLAPTELVNRVVERAVAESEGTLLIFDGYPRNREEVEFLQNMERRGSVAEAVIVVLHLTRATAVKRISGRRECKDCGQVYNVSYDPPQSSGVCDECGGDLRQRPDDRPEVVEKRLDEFESETLPAIEVFQALRPHRMVNVSAEDSFDTFRAAADRVYEIEGLYLTGTA